MFLLLSNDDGYLSPGLRALIETLSPEVQRLAAVAPDRDCSGASHSLTLSRPLRITQHDDTIFSVDGTPSDCVNIATRGFFSTAPDMVISGINLGANLGDDIMYSGTVAAAFEGRHLGLPAIAVSSCAHQPKHLATAAKITKKILAHLKNHPLLPTTLLNVNIPDLPEADIKGFRTTVLGTRHASGEVIQTTDPRGKTIYWIGANGAINDDSQQTDFYAIRHGYVSITPLQFDLTDHQKYQNIATWLEGLT